MMSLHSASRCFGFLVVTLSLLVAACGTPSADTPSSNASQTASAETQSAPDRSDMLPRTSPNAAVSQTVGVSEVRISYGRPSMRGRTIFGDLVSYDDVWRTGANEATTITFSDDVQIEGQALSAGTYGLFTIPGEDEWTVIFNNEPDQWGAFNYDEGQDALRVDVAPTSTNRPWEMMTFTVENVSDTSATAALYWANTKVPFSMTFDTPSIIRTRANNAAANAQDWQLPFQYAAYALQNEIMTEDALTWIDRSIELEENFNNLAVKAQLLAANEQYGEAASVGQQAIQVGENMDEAPRGLEQLQNQVSDWRDQ